MRVPQATCTSMKTHLVCLQSAESMKMPNRYSKKFFDFEGHADRTKSRESQPQYSLVRPPKNLL